MYAVIFRARMAQIDDEYLQIVKRLRALAMKQYGCLDFVSVLEGDEEITVSYWENEAQIARWKNDATHQLAQKKGRSKWYKFYRVEICEVKRKYEIH